MVSVAYFGLMFSVIGSLIYVAVYQRAVPSIPRMVSKGCTNAGLFVFAFGFGAPWALLLAIALMFITDIILVSGRFRDRKLMIIAMITSVAGQGAFMMLFAQHWAGLDSWMFGLIALGGFSLGILTMLWDQVRSLLIPVMIYILSISAMTYFSFGLMDEHRLAVYGCVLFIVQSVIHAFEQFHIEPDTGPIRVTAPAIWMMYHGSILLITLAFLFPRSV